MSNLRVGVIGANGGQGRTWAKRIKLWQNLDGNKLDLVAVCDKDEMGLPIAQNQFKCAGYLDYNEMFEKEKLDLVIIATPHFLHAPMAIAAAEHGINILSEKPMCINLEQADAIKAAVDKAGVKFAVGFQNRFNPINAGLKNAISSGDLGDIFQLNMLFHWWRTEDYYLNSTPVPENEDEDWEGWRGHWRTEGAGALANQLIHYLDVFQWLSPSPIKAVTAASRVAKHTFVETDDNSNIIVEFENGSMGFIQGGVAYQYGDGDQLAIYGTKGALVKRKNIRGPFGIPKKLEDLRSAEIKKKKKLSAYMPKVMNPSKNLLRNLLEAIEKDDASLISVDVNEGRKSIELMRAILLSQKYEKKITLPFTDPATEFPELLHTYVDPKFKDAV